LGTGSRRPRLAFRGWPAEALEFFERLEAENSKSFWQRNKEIYEAQVRAPMGELLQELAPEFGEGRISRPYRDIRTNSTAIAGPSTMIERAGSWLTW
jgi:uncharacterized protein (DUF2461 family)